MSGAVMLTSMLRFTFGSPRDSLVAETGSCVVLCHLHQNGVDKRYSRSQCAGQAPSTASPKKEVHTHMAQSDWQTPCHPLPHSAESLCPSSQPRRTLHGEETLEPLCSR